MPVLIHCVSGRRLNSVDLRPLDDVFNRHILVSGNLRCVSRPKLHLVEEQTAIIGRKKRKRLVPDDAQKQAESVATVEHRFLLAARTLQVADVHANLVRQHLFLFRSSRARCRAVVGCLGRGSLGGLSDELTELPLVFRIVDLHISEDGAIGKRHLTQRQVAPANTSRCIKRFF